MRLPVRIFSDLHLGHKASRIDDVEALRPLFRGAGTVVFNGDSWEELLDHWRERSKKMLDELQRILKEEGCDSIFLRGNHDPGWEGKGWLELAEGRILITHGDALLRDGAPWKREMIRKPEVVDALWEQVPGAECDPALRHELAQKISQALPSRRPAEGKRLIQNVMDAIFPPKRALEIIRVWITQGRLAADFAQRYFPKAEFIVNGHFHMAGIRRVGGRIVLNTGTFIVPTPAKWVEWDGKMLSTGWIRAQENVYKMCGADGYWRLF